MLCSTENEDRSHVIAALDEYRLQAPLSCASSGILKSYLARQLCLPNSFNGYYNDKKKTDEKILKDVFKKGDSYFNSGDLLKRCDDYRLL